jgi:hypothetical protein
VTDRHPDAELTVVRRWASGVTHLAWVGGWEHSVDITEVLGRSVVVARPPLLTLCGAILRGPWPFKRAGDLVICMDDDRATCSRCRRVEAMLPHMMKEDARCG